MAMGGQGSPGVKKRKTEGAGEQTDSQGHKLGNMSWDRRKSVFWGFLARFGTNMHVESQKKARSLKFRLCIDEKLCYPCSENKGTD